MMIGSIAILLLLVGGIYLYKTYALYEEKKEFNILKGKVPFFPKKGANLNDYIIYKHEIYSSIEAFDHAATSQTKSLTDYRYTGSNPDNYVYFGCEEDACTEDNLYRIIGVMPTQSTIGGGYENRVKLVKNKEYSTTYWASSQNNNWEKSLANATLNGTFWNSLGEYQNYIAPSVWYLGALPTPYRVHYSENGPDGFYSEERGSKKAFSGGSLSYVRNIGLMYVSDYGYSLGKNYRNTKIGQTNSKYVSSSWLYNGYYREWLISPNTEFYDATDVEAWVINMEGGVVIVNVHTIQSSNGTVYHYKYPIRPTFYLKSNVLYDSGDGSLENPYRIYIS